MRNLSKAIGLPLATALAVMLSASGCGGSSPKAVPDCPKSFDFDSIEQPLGDVKLRTSARTIALGTESATMRAVASGGGLKGDWDRMVVVFPGTTIAALNSDVGTTEFCWENLPPAYGDDTPHTAYYLFVNAGEPVQAVSWFYPNDRTLDFTSPKTTVVYPDTLMVPVHISGVEPFLRPIAQ